MVCKLENEYLENGLEMNIGKTEYSETHKEIRDLDFENTNTNERNR